MHHSEISGRREAERRQLESEARQAGCRVVSTELERKAFKASFAYLNRWRSASARSTYWQEQQRQQAAALAASVFPCHTCFNQEELELKRREDEAHEPSLQLLLRGLKWTSQAIDAIGRKAQNFE